MFRDHRVLSAATLRTAPQMLTLPRISGALQDGEIATLIWDAKYRRALARSLKRLRADNRLWNQGYLTIDDC